LIIGLLKILQAHYPKHREARVSSISSNSGERFTIKAVREFPPKDS